MKEWLICIGQNQHPFFAQIDFDTIDGFGTAFAILLTQNTQLATKLSNLLPKGSDLQAAASGYKNLGQFVAAVHVSHNLRIPFNQLKCTELATPDACPSPLTQPSRSTSLGGAIQTLKPTMTSSESKAAAKQAQKQASSDVNETPS